MNYGTYSTIDAPTDKIDEACEFLVTQFETIGGQVRKIINPHDMGGYPSFEIDYPANIEKISEFIDDYDDDQFENDDELEAKRNEYEKIIEAWHDKANTIQQAYNAKFEAYL